MFTKFSNVDDILSNINTNRILIIALAVLLIVTWAWAFNLQSKINQLNERQNTTEKDVKDLENWNRYNR